MRETRNDPLDESMLNNHYNHRRCWFKFSNRKKIGSNSLRFEPNEIPSGSKSKGKLSTRSYPIKFERKWNTNFLGAQDFPACDGPDT